LEILKREGELHIIDLPIDPYLELAEIQRRVVSRQGKFSSSCGLSPYAQSDCSIILKAIAKDLDTPVR
jgi:hypothetical protein